VKKFNITGVCIPDKHYMVNLDNKIKEIVKLIEEDAYFTVNRARQYGKTTLLSQLYRTLKDQFLIIKISFEGLGEKAFSSENEFCESFINLVAKRLKMNNIPLNVIAEWENHKNRIDKFERLSDKITALVTSSDKEAVLIIDEVDKSTDNQLFLHFIGMLRTKFLERNEGLDRTFKSVILAGVYDVKNLKLKLRSDQEKKYNSPWNIAANFDVDMAFNSEEISTMLVDYENDLRTGMDIKKISGLLYDYTSGYPFLVSRLCKVIEEDLNRKWNEEGLKKAVNLILNEKNTLFDDLIKNIEEDPNLYKTVYEIVVEGKSIIYNIDAHEKGTIFSIFAVGKTGKIKVHNRIFELRIYNYMIAKREMEKGQLLTYEYRTNFISENGDLRIETVLIKFQELMKAEYREKDKKFIEREGRLIFLAFLKPIINGTGFYFVEPETRQDNRMDVVITYNKKQYIIELKIWNGEKYEEKGIGQLGDYLEARGEEQGYLVVFNFNRKKEYTQKWLDSDGKRIFEIVV
jgi:hypothetical protein